MDNMGGIWNILREQTDLKNHEKKHLGDQAVINSYALMFLTGTNLELNPISDVTYFWWPFQIIFETKK